MIRLARVGVRQAQRVAASPVKGVFEMEDFRAARTVPRRQVLAHLPIHCCFEGVFHRQCPAFDKKVAFQRRQSHHAVKRLHEAGVGNRIDIRIGHFGPGSQQQVGLNLGTLEPRMIEPDRHRAVKTVKVKQLPPSDGIDDLAAVTVLEV